MKEFGLMRGCLYRHFSPKDESIPLSALRAVSETITGWRKALRRKQAIVAFAFMVGGMTLARMASNGELRREILKDVARVVSSGVSATV
jgi:hypothetical protein